MSSNKYRIVRRQIMARLSLKGDSLYDETLSTEEIQKIVAEEIKKIYKQNDGFDLEEDILDKLVSDIASKYGVKEEDEIKQFTADDVNHINWETDAIKADIDNHPAWTSFYDFYSEDFPQSVLNDINRNSNKILFKLESPKRPGVWSSKGLVVGEVQSGKTMNMLALVNKSIAAGYRFIIILTGLSEILRKQTQERFDEGVLGYHTATETTFNPIGVGNFRAREDVDVVSYTTDEVGGDVKSITVNRNIQPSENRTTVLVMKKIPKLLEHIKNNLSRWTEKEKIDSFPLLLIDDECDNASVNTANVSSSSSNGSVKTTAESPSTTNKLIREILEQFSRSCYVGFTATAYANLFINHLLNDEKYGRDLFPDHISFLPHYENYLGYKSMFPDEGEDSLIEKIDDFATENDQAQLELYYEGKIRRRDLEFEDSWLPPIHSPTWKLNNGQHNELPESLQRAIQHFVISLAIKKIRKIDDEISTMLIHVSLYNKIHSQLVEHLNVYLQKFRERNFSSFKKIEEQMKSYYENEMQENLYLDYNPNREIIHWDEIKNQLRTVLSNIDIIPMNNEYDSAHKVKSKDRKIEKIWSIHPENPEIASQIQSYVNAKKKGVNCICIGGNQLARGLTLTGLTVNYFLRDQKTGNNDTMTQMGRWFGYREKYQDLCKLFTSAHLIEKFRKFSLQKENFMRRIKTMDEGKYTPRQIGTYIVMYSGISPTSKNKMRNGEQVFIQLVYDADHTYELHPMTSNVNHNYEVVNNLLNGLEDLNINQQINRTGNWLFWDDIPSSILLDKFFEKYSESTEQIRNGTFLKDQMAYIKKMNEYSELINWTFGLYVGGSVENTLGEFVLSNNKISFKAALRSRPQHFRDKTTKKDTWDGDPSTLENENIKFYSIGSLTGPSDELADLAFRHDQAKNKKTSEYAKYLQLLEDNKDKAKKPLRQFVRESRDPKRGFLMIIPVFPKEKNTTEKILKPYLSYAISFPQSRLLHQNPKLIEEIFEPQKVIANTVHLQNRNRVGYEYDDDFTE